MNADALLVAAWTHDIDPIIVSIFGVHLWWYGLCFVLGFLSIQVWLRRQGDQLGLSPRGVWDLTLCTSLGVLVGGHRSAPAGCTLLHQGEACVKLRETTTGRYTLIKRKFRVLATTTGLVISNALAAMANFGQTKDDKTEPSSAPATRAQEILTKMLAAYQACKSYRDTGEVTNKRDAEGMSLEGKHTFSTAFVRPDRFRFESKGNMFGRGPDRDHVIWAVDGAIRIWATGDAAAREHKTIGESLYRFLGTSGGSAGLAPRLLIGEHNWMHLPNHLRSPKLLAEEKIGGVLCYKIQGQPHGGEKRDRHTVRIDNKSYLIRKMVEKASKLGTTTMTYKPEIDVDIADDAFTFAPPRD